MCDKEEALSPLLGQRLDNHLGWSTVERCPHRGGLSGFSGPGSGEQESCVDQGSLPYAGGKPWCMINLSLIRSACDRLDIRSDCHFVPDCLREEG